VSTASITLRTGLPGSGKSLRTIERILEELEAGTTVYTCNINDLSIKGVIDFPDPTRWRELPANSVLFVDECQRFFPSRRAGEVPPHIRAMETIRHDGVRLELMTQRPTYIDAHIRGLVGVHEHLLRRNGKDESQLFRWDEVEDEPKSETARRKADVASYHFRPSLFQHYKSAEIHTVKRRINWRTKKGAAILSVVALMFAGVAWFFYDSVFAGYTQASEYTTASGDSAATPTKPEARNSDTEDAETDPVLKFSPRLAGLPWTAPAYDDFPVMDYPRAFCMISGDQRFERITCRCFSQQATPLDVDDVSCISIARNGYWDARRAPDLPLDDRRGFSGPAETMRQDTTAIPRPAPVGIGAGINRALVLPYVPPDRIIAGQ